VIFKVFSKEERLIWVHDLRDFSPWSLGPVAVEPEAVQTPRQMHSEKNNSRHLMVARKGHCFACFKIRYKQYHAARILVRIAFIILLNIFF
jgi:hypothetical protein